MTNDEAALAVIDALESLGVPYMVVGSLASNLYGIPRMTQDADFVLEIDLPTLRTVADRLGAAFRLDPQMGVEMVTGTSRYVLQVVETPFTIEFFLLSDDPHDRQRFARRQMVTVLGRKAAVPTAEDVIVTKLRWWREVRRPKDLQDARGILAVQGDRIDWDYVQSWCDRHGTREILDELRQSTPRI